MRTLIYLLVLFLGGAIAHAEDEFRVSKVGKDKATLLSYFKMIQTAEHELAIQADLRANIDSYGFYNVVQKISESEFLVKYAHPKKIHFHQSLPAVREPFSEWTVLLKTSVAIGADDGDKLILKRAVDTGREYNYTTVSGFKRAAKIFESTGEKWDNNGGSIPKMTQEEFVAKLRAGKTWKQYGVTIKW